MLNKKLPFIQDSLSHDKIKEYRTTLDNIESSIQTVSNDKRKHSWMETGNDVLRYIGYVSIGIILFYASYRIGVFKCLS